MVKECDDFEIVFGLDKPKWGQGPDISSDDDGWMEGLEPETLIALAASENVSMFGLCFRGRPIIHRGPQDTNIVRQLRCGQGWIVLTQHFASEHRQFYGPKWMPYRWLLNKYFPRKYAEGQLCMNALYFDQSLKLRQVTLVSGFWPVQVPVTEHTMLQLADLKTDLVIEDQKTFHLDVMDSERLTFKLNETRPRLLPRSFRRNVEYESEFWHRAWFEVYVRKLS